VCKSWLSKKKNSMLSCNCYFLSRKGRKLWTFCKRCFWDWGLLPTDSRSVASPDLMALSVRKTNLQTPVMCAPPAPGITAGTLISPQCQLFGWWEGQDKGQTTRSSEMQVASDSLDLWRAVCLDISKHPEINANQEPQKQQRSILNVDVEDMAIFVWIQQAV